MTSFEDTMLRKVGFLDRNLRSSRLNRPLRFVDVFIRIIHNQLLTDAFQNILSIFVHSLLKLDLFLLLFLR